MQRTRSAIEQADLVLIIFDRSQPLDENDDLISKEVGDKPRLVIINKCDLPETWFIDDLKLNSFKGGQGSGLPAPDPPPP